LSGNDAGHFIATLRQPDAIAICSLEGMAALAATSPP